MKLRAQRTLLFLGLLASLALCAAPAGAGSKPTPTIQQKIDALLKHRLNPEPLPIDLPNPFIVSTGNVRDFSLEGAKIADGAESKAGGGASLLLPSSAEVLADCSARLKIGGIIVVSGVKQIIVNGILRREGDIVTVELNSTAVPIQLVNFQPGQVTFRYRDAEAMLKF